MPRLALESPVGRLCLFEEEGRLTVLDWGGKRSAGEIGGELALGVLQKPGRLASRFSAPDQGGDGAAFLEERQSTDRAGEREPRHGSSARELGRERRRIGQG